MLNETICVVESLPSDVALLNIGRWGGMSIALAITIIAVIGFIVRALFIYFLKYEAPNDRPINELMIHEQVRN